MSGGISRLEANRFAVPAGMIASVAPLPASTSIAPLHHPVAAPDEHELGAFVERTLDALGRVLALRHLRPDTDRSTPARSSSRRSSSSPPPIVLPAWAITATFFTSSRPVAASPRVRGGGRRARGEDGDAERDEAHQHARGDVGQVVHAAVASATRSTKSARAIARATRASRTSGGSTREASRSSRPPKSATDAAVWPEGKLASTGEPLEPVDVGPVALDDERRRPVRARLDADHEQRERGEPPVRA